MRYLILFLVVFPACSHGWTRNDTYRQATIAGLQLVDWRQTRHIANNPQDHYEQNPILGDHPAIGRVNVFFVTAIASQALISYLLPRDWRPVWQYVTIGYETKVTLDNYRAGIRW